VRSPCPRPHGRCGVWPADLLVAIATGRGRRRGGRFWGPVPRAWVVGLVERYSHTPTFARSRFARSAQPPLARTIALASWPPLAQRIALATKERPGPSPPEGYSATNRSPHRSLRERPVTAPEPALFVRHVGNPQSRGGIGRSLLRRSRGHPARWLLFRTPTSKRPRRPCLRWSGHLAALSHPALSVVDVAVGQMIGGEDGVAEGGALLGIAVRERCGRLRSIVRSAGAVD